MEKEKFIQNVKYYCKIKGVKPTPACQACGIGTSFLNNIERGQKPSVESVQKLAQYLGVTTSDLLGEEKPAGYDTSGMNEEQMEVIELYKRASPEMRAAMLQALRAAEAARPSQGGAKGAV